MYLPFEDPEEYFGQIKILVGQMGGAKSAFAVILAAYLEYLQELNCETHIFTHTLNNRPFLSRLVIGRDREFTRVGTAKELSDYIEQKTTVEKPKVLVIDEVELFDSAIVGTLKKLASEGNALILSALERSFRNEDFSFSDYESDMSDLLRIIPERNIYRSDVAKCKVCRKRTATHTQRLVDGQPANYYDPLIMIDSKKDQEPAKKKYSYEARCEKDFKLPGKKEYDRVSSLIDCAHGITIDHLAERSQTNFGIEENVVHQIVKMMLEEKRAIKLEDGKLYYAPKKTCDTRIIVPEPSIIIPQA